HEQFERNRYSITNTERFILELFLIVYLFPIIARSLIVNSAFIWLIVATLGGVIAYFLFSKGSYTFIKGLILSAFMAYPFCLFDMPFFMATVLFVFIFWRLNQNFTGGRGSGWPFLGLNTFLFVLFYFIVMNLFQKPFVAENIKLQVTLFLLTTFLFIVIRFASFSLMSRHITEIKLVDSSKLFGIMLGLGVLSFVFIHFFFTPFRNGIIAIAGFIFGGLYYFVTQVIVAPIWDLIVKRLK